MTAKPSELLTDNQTHNNDTLLRADGSQFYRLCEGSRAGRLFDCRRPPGIHAVTVLRFCQWAVRQVTLLRWSLTSVYVFSTSLSKYSGASIFHVAHALGQGSFANFETECFKTRK